MNRIAYYHTEIESDANICDLFVPLAVNCAGIERSHKKANMRRCRKDYYLLFINSGTHFMEIGDTIHTLPPDSFMLIEPDTYVCHTSTPGYIQYHWVHFTGNYLPKLLERLDFPVNLPVSLTFPTRSGNILNRYSGIF